MGWLYDTKYLFFYLSVAQTHTLYQGKGMTQGHTLKPLLNIRHYRCGTTWQHLVTFFYVFLEEHTHAHICISERGWDKGIHFHSQTKTACGSWCREASNKSLLNITRYWCRMTLHHSVSFYFYFLLRAHTYTHIYRGRRMRQGNTPICQQQNYMPHLVSRSKL